MAITTLVWRNQELVAEAAQRIGGILRLGPGKTGLVRFGHGSLPAKTILKGTSSRGSRSVAELLGQLAAALVEGRLPCSTGLRRGRPEAAQLDRATVAEPVMLDVGDGFAAFLGGVEVVVRPIGVADAADRLVAGQGLRLGVGIAHVALV